MSSKAASNGKVYLDRAAILSVSDITTEEVWVEPWHSWVRVRGLTGTERDRYQRSVLDQRGKTTKVIVEEATAKLVALSVVDEAGNRVFSNADIAALNAKNSGALDIIFKVASRLSGISDDDIEELGKLSEQMDRSGASVSP